MKIDISKIKGYAEMTPEQKLAAIEALELPEPDLSGYVKKDVADKYASEAAKYRKELTAKMSEEEAAKVKAAEEYAAMQAELEELKTARSIDQNTAKFLSLGYDQKMAAETAEALVKGDMEKVFSAQAKFIELKEKAMRAEILKSTPKPASGREESDRETFEKMTLTEKAVFKANNPEAYKAMFGGDK